MRSNPIKEMPDNDQSEVELAEEKLKMSEKLNWRSQAFYLYWYDGNKYTKTTKQNKKCAKEKCLRWRGVDSDGLVWCDEWNIGDCSYPLDTYGEPYGGKFVPESVPLALDAERDQIIKELCGLITDLYHQHREIATEYEAEIQTLKKHYTEKFICCKKEGSTPQVGAVDDCINCPENIDCIEGRKRTAKVASELRGVIAEANKILAEFPNLIVMDKGSADTVPIAYFADDSPTIQEWLERLRTTLSQVQEKEKTTT